MGKKPNNSQAGMSHDDDLTAGGICGNEALPRRQSGAYGGSWKERWPPGTDINTVAAKEGRHVYDD